MNILYKNAGVPANIVSQLSPSERLRLSLLGIIVFIPGVMAFLTFAYFIYTYSSNILIILGFASIWAFIIYIIDRAFASSRNKKGFSLWARIALIVVISYTISEPVLVFLNHDLITERADLIRENVKQHIIDRDTAKIAALEGEIKSLADSVTAATKLLTYEGAGYNSNMEKGKGEAYNNFKVLLQHHQGQLDAVRAANTAKIYDIIKHRNEDIQKRQSQMAVGFHGKHKILSAIAAEDDSVFWNMIIWRLFFIFIDLLVIFLKDSLVSPDSLCYLLMDRENQGILSAVDRTSSKRAEVADLQQRNIFDALKKKLQEESTRKTMEANRKTFVFLGAEYNKLSKENNRILKTIRKNVKDEKTHAQLVEDVQLAYNQACDVIRDQITKNAEFFKAA